MKINKKMEAFLKILLIITICISGGFFVSIGDSKDIVRAATDDSEGITGSTELDIIIIDNKDYKKDRKGPVSFNHKKHGWEYKIFCWQCHHDYKEGENVWSAWGTTKKCNQCHNPITEQGAAVKLKKAYHLNCKTCHKELAVFGEQSSAYRKCNRCHTTK